MNVNKLVRNLGKTLAGRPKTRKSSKRNNRRRNNRRRNNNGRINRALPAAYSSHVRARFTIVSRNSTRCVVSGCDLVYAIPATLASSGDTIFTVIPCNPAYWLGTRIARIAPAYQNYRPLQFKVSYIPQVAVTQAGTVFMGTLWDQAAPTQNIQQSLVTSNGGQLTQCYIPADSHVILGRNLQQNLFKITGALDTDTNPFVFLAGVRGASVVPGYFYVTYRYEFKNPIGDAWTFVNSGLSTIADLPPQQASANGTLILLNQVGSLGPGTQLDRESDGIYYQGSPIELDNQTQVVYLNNFQTSVQTAALMNVNAITPTIIDEVSFGNNVYTLSDFFTGSGNVVLPDTDEMLILIVDAGEFWRIRLLNGQTTPTNLTRYKVVPEPTGDFEFSIFSLGNVVARMDAESPTNEGTQDFMFSKAYFSM